MPRIDKQIKERQTNCYINIHMLAGRLRGEDWSLLISFFIPSQDPLKLYIPPLAMSIDFQDWFIKQSDKQTNKLSGAVQFDFDQFDFEQNV